TSNWLTISTLATNFTLGSARSTNITASINSAANSLSPGIYTDTINFSNTATGVSFSRGVTLTVLSGFQVWQIQYFGSTNDPAAAAGVDVDGDGQDNMTEFLTGTNPTNAASAFCIRTIEK